MQYYITFQILFDFKNIKPFMIGYGDLVISNLFEAPFETMVPPTSKLSKNNNVIFMLIRLFCVSSMWLGTVADVSELHASILKVGITLTV